MNILRIVAKDMRLTAIITGAFCVVFTALAILANFVPAVMILVCAVGFSGIYLVSALLTAERYEDKNNGYSFLIRMPVLPVELATGKLLLMYLLNLIACGLVIVLIRVYGTETRIVEIFQSAALMAGCIWLFVIALAYSGICVLGFTKFIVAFRVVILVLLVAIQAAGVLAFRVASDLSGMLNKIGDGIAAAPWLLICVFASAAYFIFMLSSGGLVRRYAAK